VTKKKKKKKKEKKERKEKKGNIPMFEPAKIFAEHSLYNII